MAPLVTFETKRKAAQCHPRIIYQRYRKRDRTYVMKFLSPSLSTSNEWMIQVEFKLPLPLFPTPEDLVLTRRVKFYGDSPSAQYWGPWFLGTTTGVSLWDCPYPPTRNIPKYQLDHHIYAVLKRICELSSRLNNVSNTNDFI